MKKHLVIFFAFIFSCSAVFAQQKAVQTVVISTPTIQCDMCKKKIEKTLFKVDGINSTKVNVKAHTVTVNYITNRTNPENIKAMISNAGYDADDYLAEEGAYKRLPACCKVPVGGNGTTH